MPIEYYTTSYYEQLRDGSARSAEIIVPLVLKLVPARSVVDVGCGVGAWLAAFRRFGVEDVLGVDGDYVDRSLLQISQDHFQAADLSKPLILSRTFDLAVSLEVAEHLPAECADAFVGSLTRLAPVVLFSAAIPFQRGNNHVNEQWPDKWAELFKKHDYLPVDFIRKRVWKNEAVDWWYAQNALLFVRANVLQGNAWLKAEFELTTPDQLRLVHPRLYLYAVAPGIRDACRILLGSLRRSIRWRLRRGQNREMASNGATESHPPKT